MSREETRGGQGYTFHYSREERLAGRDLPAQKPRGLFRRNRSLAIILLDVLLILLISVLFQFVFTPGRSRARVGDYDLRLDAFRFEGEVYLSVEVTRARNREEAPDASLVTVRFPGNVPVLDVLPSVAEKPTTVTAVTGETGGEVVVEVDLLGETVTLRAGPRN